MKTLAFVQARQGSTRLPGKVLAPLGGQPMLQRLLERLRSTPSLDGVMVLTSTHPANDPICELSYELGIPVCRGSEEDVLGRFRQAVDMWGPDTVVRITADCPLIDPGLIGALTERHHAVGAHYSSVAAGDMWGKGLKRYPHGLDAEAIATQALQIAVREAIEPDHREHVTRFFWRNPGRFLGLVMQSPVDWGDERWTVDHSEDLEFVSAVFDHFGDSPFGFQDVLRLLNAEPSLRDINSSRRIEADWGDTTGLPVPEAWKVMTGP